MKTDVFWKAAAITGWLAAAVEFVASYYATLHCGWPL